MPNFISKGVKLQKLAEAARAAKKVQGSITFDPDIRLEKINKLPLRGHMFLPCVKIL